MQVRLLLLSCEAQRKSFVIVIIVECVHAQLTVTSSCWPLMSTVFVNMISAGQANSVISVQLDLITKDMAASD